MYAHVRHAQILTDNTCFLRYGFLVSRFSPTFYYWEVVLLARSAVLVPCLILLDRNVSLQTMTGILVMGVWLRAHDVRKVCVRMCMLLRGMM